MSRTVRFAASAIGTPWWEMGILLKKWLAGGPYDIEPESHSVDIANPRYMKGECELGVTWTPYLEWAVRGLGCYAGEKFPEFRVIAAINRPTWLAAGVARSAGISSMAEIAQKRYPWKALLPRSDGGIACYFDRALELHGMSRESISSWGGGEPAPYGSPEVPAGQPRVVQANTEDFVRRGEIDGFFSYIYWTSLWARQLMILMDLKFIRFEQNAMDTLQRELGGEKMTLPARIFPGADEDMPVLGWRHLYLYGREDIEDDLVIAVLRALEGSGDTLLDNAHGLSYNGRMPVLEAGLQLHPTAAEFYRSGQKT